MAHNTREYILRHADHCLNDLNRALSEVEQVIILYKGGHDPDDPEGVSAAAVEEPTEADRYAPYIKAVQGVGFIVAQALEAMSALRENM